MSEKNKRILEYLSKSNAPNDIIMLALDVQNVLENYEEKQSTKKTSEMIIVDIGDMPNYDPKVKDGIDSVSSGRVILKKYKSGQYPHCIEHGAMLRVSIDGIWRCPTCRAGCYELEKNKLF